jgi:hypothetical protein
VTLSENQFFRLKYIIRGQISSLINFFTLKTLGAAQF